MTIQEAPAFSRICGNALCESKVAGAMFWSRNRIDRILRLCIFLHICVAAHFPATAQTVGRAGQPAAHNFPLTKFYDTPDPLPQANPGQLIRSADFDQYNLPLHISAVRFLYYSRSANGAPVAASGVVLFPDHTPPPGGWPVIAWAHTLNGVARQCAPSLDRNLQHGPFLAMYVNLGYAVVATDYTGLGTNFRNAYADAVSNAWNVIDAIPAARSALPQLSARWLALGTGDGGAAVIKVAELEHDGKDANYLGSVAISPAADLEDEYGTSGKLSPDAPLFLAYGIQTVFPQFELTHMLAEKALSAYQTIGKACVRSDRSANESAAQSLKPNWQTDEIVQKFFRRNQLGHAPAQEPFLVINGDTSPTIQQTSKIVDRMCGQKDRVQFEKFVGFDSGEVIGDSVRDQMSWIEARFKNRATLNDCPSHP
jgi:hypothetical protein